MPFGEREEQLARLSQKDERSLLESHHVLTHSHDYVSITLAIVMRFCHQFSFLYCRFVRIFLSPCLIATAQQRLKVDQTRTRISCSLKNMQFYVVVNLSY